MKTKFTFARCIKHSILFALMLSLIICFSFGFTFKTYAEFWPLLYIVFGINFYWEYQNYLQRMINEKLEYRIKELEDKK